METRESSGSAESSSRAVLMSLLQICDSSFPIGGFTHSGGVESAWRRGAVPDLESLQLFLKTAVLATCSQQIPYMEAAYQVAAAAAGAATGTATPADTIRGSEDRVPEESSELSFPGISRILALDELLDVSISNHVTKRSSTQQGKSLLSLALEVFPEKQRWLSCLLKAKDEGAFEGNLAIVLGTLCALLGVGLTESLDAFVFSTLRNSVAAAVRLGRVGPVQAQKLQQQLLPFCSQTVSRFRNIKVGADHQSDPVLDVLQGAQDRLFTKMFYS